MVVIVWYSSDFPGPCSTSLFTSFYSRWAIPSKPEEESVPDEIVITEWKQNYYLFDGDPREILIQGSPLKNCLGTPFQRFDARLHITSSYYYITSHHIPHLITPHHTTSHCHTQRFWIQISSSWHSFIFIIQGSPLKNCLGTPFQRFDARLHITSSYYYITSHHIPHLITPHHTTSHCHTQRFWIQISSSWLSFIFIIQGSPLKNCLGTPFQRFDARLHITSSYYYITSHLIPHLITPHHTTSHCHTQRFWIQISSSWLSFIFIIQGSPLKNCLGTPFQRFDARLHITSSYYYITSHLIPHLITPHHTTSHCHTQRFWIQISSSWHSFIFIIQGSPLKNCLGTPFQRFDARLHITSSYYYITSHHIPHLITPHHTTSHCHTQRFWIQISSSWLSFIFVRQHWQDVLPVLSAPSRG